MVQQILRLFDNSLAEELTVEELTIKELTEERITEEHITEEGMEERLFEERLFEEYLEEYPDDSLDEQDESYLVTGTLLQETQQLFHSDGSEAELVALIHKAIDAIHQMCDQTDV
jgi:hypothetical protein